jgi:hypothetical protein
MTVGELKRWIRGLEDNMEVIVCDGDSEYDAFFTTGINECGEKCVVIDLTVDCER